MLEMEPITSRRNPLVRRFRECADDPGDHLLLDGAHLIEEALSAGVPIELVAVGNVANDGMTALARRAQDRGARLVTVTAEVMKALSPVRQPSGIVALGRRRERTLDDALRDAPQMVLMLEEVQDPGNVGAIVRAADACGATGIVTGHGSADAFGWKALRGSMGSAFRVPIAVRQSLAEAARTARDRGVRVLAAVPRDGEALPQSDLRGPLAVLLGGEGAGLSDALVSLASGRLTIPMRPPVESLNVATAAALIAYEARRQRTSRES
jgi:TrmH family RNA methyltransferase